MNIEIIPAVIDDAEALAAIQKQAFERLYSIYHDEGSPYLRGAEEIAVWLERPNWRVYKIHVDGKLCGGVAFCERNGMPGVYYLARIYILPKLQGNGIASTAILLCEATVANANLWTLDFPVNETANRRCYEKVGYTDTGERREQSGGAITLAYMEKKIPAFRDVKAHLDNPIIRQLITASAFDTSPEATSVKVDEFRRCKNRHLYGWVDQGEFLGVCGIEIHSDYVEILNIAVAENVRKQGIGGQMVAALQEKYKLPVKAETDDDAVGFYRKCGFETTEIQKYNVRRYICVKPSPIETDEERHARIYSIILSEYNPAWPEWYAEERDNLTRLLGEHIIRIQHIGSTAVPGLMAKPTVDILLEVPAGTDFDRIVEVFRPFPEYICLYPPTNPEPLCVIKGYTDTGFAERVFHIHVREAADYDEPVFRDYLIAHPDAAAEYTALKRKLKDEYDVVRYADEFR